MNQTAEFVPADKVAPPRPAAINPAAINPAAPKPAANPPPPLRLTRADATALHGVLVQGDDALAMRKDIGELHKRLVAMLTTLDTGLSDRQAARADSDRMLLSARLDGMERSINSVEGVLRIEMEPLLRSAVAEAVAAHVKAGEARPRTGAFGVAMLAVATVAALFLGAAFSGDINGFRADALAALQGLEARAIAVVSPDGGSAVAGNQVE